MTGRRRLLVISGILIVAASAAWVSAIVLPASVRSAAPSTTTKPASKTIDSPRAEPADPKSLQALLPATLGTAPQADTEAGLRTLGEMRSSLAQATFGTDAKPDAGHGTVKIVDYIAMPGLIESVAPWQSLTIENETDAEYTRTLTIDKYKAIETYTKQTRSGSINVLVAGRFVVTIEVVGMSPETLRSTASALKLDDLAALAK